MAFRPGKLRELVDNDSDFRRQLLEADIIVAVEMDGSEAIFLGRRLLKQIVKTNKSASHNLVRIVVDNETDDIEFLTAFCQTFRGGCDYGKG